MPPEIHLNNLRIAKDHVCRTIGDFVAEMKHHKMAAEFGHHPYVMVDEAYADAELMDAAKQLNEFGAFLR